MKKMTAEETASEKKETSVPGFSQLATVTRKNRDALRLHADTYGKELDYRKKSSPKSDKSKTMAPKTKKQNPSNRKPRELKAISRRALTMIGSDEADMLRGHADTLKEYDEHSRYADFQSHDEPEESLTGYMQPRVRKTYYEYRKKYPKTKGRTPPMEYSEKAKRNFQRQVETSLALQSKRNTAASNNENTPKNMPPMAAPDTTPENPISWNPLRNAFTWKSKNTENEASGNYATWNPLRNAFTRKARTPEKNGNPVSNNNIYIDLPDVPAKESFYRQLKNVFSRKNTDPYNANGGYHRRRRHRRQPLHRRNRH